MDNEDFAISGFYVLREVLTENDLVVVKFVDKSESLFQKIQPQTVAIDHITRMNPVPRPMGNVSSMNRIQSAPHFPSRARPSYPLEAQPPSHSHREQQAQSQQAAAPQLVRPPSCSQVAQTAIGNEAAIPRSDHSGTLCDVDANKNNKAMDGNESDKDAAMRKNGNSYKSIMLNGTSQTMRKSVTGKRRVRDMSRLTVYGQHNAFYTCS